MKLIDWAERGLVPDWAIRIGIRRMLRARLREERSRERTSGFAASLRSEPIAVATDAANVQHYEVPAEFFEVVLGPRLKYSCCLFGNNEPTLAQAEEAMLDLTCRRAEIEDGMDVLDLGCGWGALSLWIAERYPRCRVTALSNSHGQRRFIEARARQRGLENVHVVTANVADFADGGEFDRVVSVEMFEHVRNAEALLGRIASWLRPGGKLFVHVFCHRELGYPFEAAGADDWMARHFFTGGIMPSFDHFERFPRDMAVVRRWAIDGRHYARTCERWLVNLDANRTRLLELFARHENGPAPAIVLQRWRMFMMACAELFAFGGGSEWLVGHYLLEPVHSLAPAGGPSL